MMRYFILALALVSVTHAAQADEVACSSGAEWYQTRVCVGQKVYVFQAVPHVYSCTPAKVTEVKRGADYHGRVYEAVNAAGADGKPQFYEQVYTSLADCIVGQYDANGFCDKRIADKDCAAGTLALGTSLDIVTPVRLVQDKDADGVRRAYKTFKFKPSVQSIHWSSTASCAFAMNTINNVTLDSTSGSAPWVLESASSPDSVPWELTFKNKVTGKELFLACGGTESNHFKVSDFASALNKIGIKIASPIIDRKKAPPKPGEEHD